MAAPALAPASRADQVRAIVANIKADVNKIRTLIDAAGAPRIPAAVLCSFICSAGHDPIQAIQQVMDGFDRDAAMAWWQAHLGDYTLVNSGLRIHVSDAEIETNMRLEGFRCVLRRRPVFIGDVALVRLHPAHAEEIAQPGRPLKQVHDPLLYSGLTTLCLLADDDTFAAARVLAEAVLNHAREGFMRLENLVLDFEQVNLAGDGFLHPLWEIAIPELRTLRIVFDDDMGLGCRVNAPDPPRQVIDLKGVCAPFLARDIYAKMIRLCDVAVEINPENRLETNGLISAHRVSLQNIRFDDLTIDANHLILDDVIGNDIYVASPKCLVVQHEDTHCRIQTAPALRNRALAGLVVGDFEPMVFRYLELPEPEPGQEIPPMAFAPAEGISGNLVVHPVFPVRVRSPGKDLYVVGGVPMLADDCDVERVFVDISYIPTAPALKALMIEDMRAIIAVRPLILIVNDKAMCELDVFDEDGAARLAAFFQEVFPHDLLPPLV